MTNIGNYTAEQVKSMVTLFKSISVDAWMNGPRASLEDCVLKGFVFCGHDGQLLTHIPMHYFIIAEECYGVDKVKNNQTFWKSFERVRDMDPREYVMNQIAHYFSTYGMEYFGLKARPYVPVQDLDIPDTMLPFNKLTVIRFVSDTEMVELINNYAKTTVSPSKDRIEQFKPLMQYLTIATDDIKSFELQIIKHDMDGTVPADPQSFLRFLVYKTTGATLLIKNKATRKAIQHAADYDTSKTTLPYDLLSKADEKQLASIFFRFKPIFLAFKKYDGCAPIINRIRRLADIYHKPMNDVNVQNFMKLVLDNRDGDWKGVMNRASNRELVKLMNYLLAAYRTQLDKDGVPGVYNIRNGRTFVRTDAPIRSNKQGHLIWTAYNAVYHVLCERLAKTLNGKTFYIPDYISYAAPVSEKQFVGNIPWGSNVCQFNPDNAFTTGIHWYDQGKDGDWRVDLDLHLNSATRHFGWNGGYTDGEEIIYTGDQTAAPLPNGAAEAYYFKPGNEAFILSVNLFSGPKDVPFTMYMTSRKPLFEKAYWHGSNYTFNPADAMFAPIPLKFNGDYDMTIGLFNEQRFFFYGGSINSGIVPTANYADFIRGLTARLKAMHHIDAIMEDCGAVVYGDEDFTSLTEDERKEVIDLSPEALTATTLLDIIDGNIE